VDEFVQQLRTYIIQHDFQLGATLPSELEIAEKFSYARNTAREALGVLKAYGVVQIKSKVGAVLVNRHFDAAMNLFSFKNLGRFFQRHSKIPQTDRDWNI
jgi:GntR family transcriptional repressor for pyruvate dehydrogenase complex